MASATLKKTCSKCNKGVGTAICSGCERAFCTKHFIEHRQELSQQMDNVGQEHDVLCRDLMHEQNTHPLLARINQWEQESITKIQVAAELARSDLQQLLEKAENNLKTSINKMTDELQTSRESDDYTELDIKKWTDQLEELRKMFINPTTVKIDYEDDVRSIIRLIKIIEQQSYELNNRVSSNMKTSFNERFDDIFGQIALSKDGLTVTCLGDCEVYSCVGGSVRYLSGVHYIRFRIEHLSTRYYSFLGIIDSSQKMTKDIWSSTSRYGWWDLNYKIVAGEEQRTDFFKTIQMGDEVTLMLDCDNRRIQLEHHRTNRIVDINVNLGMCPFPWKIIVILLQKSDCVRILQ